MISNQPDLRRIPSLSKFARLCGRSQVFLFAAILFTISGGNLVAARAQEPSMAPAFSMVPRKTVLKNGVTVLVNEDRSTSVVAGQITFTIGAQDEQVDEAGIRHLLAHASYGRALRCASDEIGRSTAFDDLAETHLAHDSLTFGFKVSTTRIDEALQRNVRALDPADVTEESLARARAAVLREIENATRAAGASLEDSHAVINAAYRDSNPRLAWSLLGDVAAINKIGLKQLREFIRRSFIAQRCWVTFSGDLDYPTAVQLASRYYGLLPSPELAGSAITPIKDAAAWTRIDQLGEGPREWLVIAYRDDATDPTDWAADLILAEIIERRLDAMRGGESPERDLMIAAGVNGMLLNASARPLFLRILASQHPGSSYNVWLLEDRVHESLNRLLKEGVPAYEVEAAAGRVQFMLDRALEDLSVRTWLFSASTIRGGSEFTLARLADRLAKLQAEDIVQHARGLISESRLVTMTLSKGNQNAGK